MKDWNENDSITVLFILVITAVGILGWQAVGWWTILTTAVITFMVAAIGSLEQRWTTKRERARAEAVFVTLDVLERDRKPMAQRYRDMPDA